MEREAASEGERANQIHCFWSLSGEKERKRKEEEDDGGMYGVFHGPYGSTTVNEPSIN
jgi:hypothetical protein